MCAQWLCSRFDNFRDMQCMMKDFLKKKKHRNDAIEKSLEIFATDDVIEYIRQTVFR